MANRARKKVFVVFGTRPEAIKLAPVILELAHRSDLFRTVACVTGQHRQMLKPMLKVFKLRADYDLKLMKPGQTLTGITTAVLNGLDRILEEELPDLVLVQGDTTTTFAAALAAFYRHIPVGHVEAGLRTQDKYNPFPEEINRRLATHIADFHFAPTKVARENLLKEGISPERILVSGNTVVDALLHIRCRIAEDPSLVPDLELGCLDGQKIVLVTAHRRESFGRELQQICVALRSLAESRPDVLVVYPVHLNPNVSKPVRRALRGIPNLRLLAPLDYVSFVALMDRASILLTDSGGIQEEGPSVGKPVLVMRKVSERPEAIEAGTACLVGTDPDCIISAVTTLLDEPTAYERMIHSSNPYGDGHAASRIVDYLVKQMYPNRG